MLVRSDCCVYSQDSTIITVTIVMLLKFAFTSFICFIFAFCSSVVRLHFSDSTFLFLLSLFSPCPLLSLLSPFLFSPALFLPLYPLASALSLILSFHLATFIVMLYVHYTHSTHGSNCIFTFHRGEWQTFSCNSYAIQSQPSIWATVQISELHIYNME